MEPKRKYERTTPMLPDDRKTANGVACKVERELVSAAIIVYVQDFGRAPKKESTAIRYALRKLLLLDAGAECAESK